MDEQEATDRFEDLCGGVSRAQMLLRLWLYACPGISADVFNKPTKKDVFKCGAKKEGFSDEQIEAFFNLCEGRH